MIGIGTELALYTFLGAETKEKPYKAYSNMVINIATIARNILSSYSKEDLVNVHIDTLVSQLKDDLDEIYNDITGYNIKVFYYMCTYQSIDKKCKFLKKKVSFGEVRKKTEDTIASMCNKLLDILDKDTKASKVNPWGKISKFDVDVYFKTKGKTAILTHNTVDLLSRFNFTDLTLLESYTGKLKPHSVWYKKLNIKYDTPLKLTWFLVGLFGDGNELVARNSIGILKTFYEVAKSRKWDILTNPESMRKHILDDPSITPNMKELKELIK